MYLSGKQTVLLGQIMQTLAEPHEEQEIREIMGDLVMQLLGAQFYASYVWQPDSLSFAQPTQINMDPLNLRAYESYYQFHDPITPLMQRYQVAVRATDVLAIEDLKKTEFFNDFLNKDGLYWGVNLYAWHQGQNLGDMRIKRISSGVKLSLRLSRQMRMSPRFRPWCQAYRFTPQYKPSLFRKSLKNSVFFSSSIASTSVARTATW
jgi:hypothetical protein